MQSYGKARSLRACFLIIPLFLLIFPRRYDTISSYKEILMKKLLSLLFALCATLSLSSCALLLAGDSTSESVVSTESATQSVEESSQQSPPASENVDDKDNESVEVSDSAQEESSTPEEKPEETMPHLFTDFDEEQKALFLRYIGEVLPFPATDEYYVEGYYEETDFENGINFYTFGNSRVEFEAYRKLFTGYKLTETYVDDYGDTWYCYKKNDIVVDMSYYYYEGEYWIDVFVYSSLSNGGEDVGGDDSSEDIGGGDSSEDIGGDIGGGDGGNGGSESDVDVLTNAGKGLPNGVNGVYTADFTKATHVKDVTDQGYYLDGCPTLSSPAVLVIPVEFVDATASSRGYSINKIEAAFNGGAGTTDYYSVHDYYYTSSYGKLDLDITVLDFWFQPEKTSSYYEKQTMDYYGDTVAVGDQMIMDEALAQLSQTMDLSKFDSDENGFIDSVVLITTLNVSSASDFHWAYRFWNVYSDDNGDYYEYDGVCANDYLWAPYQFLHEDVDKNGNAIYSNTSAVNTYTYIHEFGHILGADDYYDTSYTNPPMDGHDIMDGMVGDHNPYSKFNYGWLTSSRIVVAEESVTLTLEDFSKNGDTIIIANNWDESLGAYQEYYVLVYYKNTGLNGGDYGYFNSEGILVYHVNASLYKEVQDGETYYDVYNNNTDVSDENGYGTEDNLIEFVLSVKGNYVYGVGDSISASTKDDQGNKIAYTFTVDSLSNSTATITFKKNK